MAKYDGKAMTRLMRGGESVPENVAVKGMAVAEKELEASVRRTLEADSARDEIDTDLEKALPELMQGQSPEMFELFVKRKNSAAKAQVIREGRKLPPLEVKPVTPRVFTGSIGGVETPAYDYQWTWFSTNGSVNSHSETANRTTGEMEISQYCGGQGGAGTVDAAAAVGYYLRPSTETGILNISTSPSYVMDLDTYSAFGTSRASAWIGLYVGEYEVGGNAFSGAPVNSKTTLGSLDTWWSSGHRDRSSSGHAMSAQFSVDNAHWYAIWVWCGGSAHAGGDGFLSNTAGFTDLEVNVPSMSWTLY